MRGTAAEHGRLRAVASFERAKQLFGRRDGVFPPAPLVLPLAVHLAHDPLDGAPDRPFLLLPVAEADEALNVGLDAFCGVLSPGAASHPRLRDPVRGLVRLTRDVILDKCDDARVLPRLIKLGLGREGEALGRLVRFSGRDVAPRLDIAETGSPSRSLDGGVGGLLGSRRGPARRPTVSAGTLRHGPPAESPNGDFAGGVVGNDLFNAVYDTASSPRAEVYSTIPSHVSAETVIGATVSWWHQHIIEGGRP